VSVGPPSTNLASAGGRWPVVVLALAPCLALAPVPAPVPGDASRVFFAPDAGALKSIHARIAGRVLCDEGDSSDGGRMVWLGLSAISYQPG